MKCRQYNRHFFVERIGEGACGSCQVPPMRFFDGDSTGGGAVKELSYTGLRNHPIDEIPEKSQRWDNSKIGFLEN